MWILVFDLAAGWAPNRVSVFSQAAAVRPIIMLLRCDSELGAFSKLPVANPLPALELE